MKQQLPYQLPTVNSFEEIQLKKKKKKKKSCCEKFKKKGKNYCKTCPLNWA